MGAVASCLAGHGRQLLAAAYSGDAATVQEVIAPGTRRVTNSDFWEVKSSAAQPRLVATSHIASSTCSYVTSLRKPSRR